MIDEKKSRGDNNKNIDYRKINFLQKINLTVNLYNRCDFKLYITVQSECLLKGIQRQWMF